MLPSPQELDRQSSTYIDRWVDLYSSECKELDNDYSFTRKVVRFLHETSDPYLVADTLGRLWGKSKDGNGYDPFHIEYGKKRIGIRISKKAAN